MQTHVSAHNVRKNTCLGYFKPINAMLDTNKHTRPLFESISLSIHHLNFIQVRKKSRIVLGFTLVNHKICHERKWCKVSEDEWCACVNLCLYVWAGEYSREGGIYFRPKFGLLLRLGLAHLLADGQLQLTVTFPLSLKQANKITGFPREEWMCVLWDCCWLADREENENAVRRRKCLIECVSRVFEE